MFKLCQNTIHTKSKFVFGPEVVPVMLYIFFSWALMQGIET